MPNIPNNIIRTVIAGLSLFGLAGVLPVSLAELASGTACPHLGPVPACHLVSLAYGTLLATVVHRRLWHPKLFLSAWLLIAALAASGSGLELLGHDVCPKTDTGFPKCYFSLALAVVIIIPYLFHLGLPKIVVQIIATILLVVGIISMPTPIPGGTLLITASLTALICTSTRVARFIGFLRARIKLLNSGMTWLEEHMGERFRHALRLTRPSPE